MGDLCGGCGHPAHEPSNDCWYQDLSACPYFARWHHLPGYDPEAVCIFGCREEPVCITDRPSEGWPSERRSA